MFTDKRKAIGVFLNRADLNFQATVQRVTRQCAREMGYDVFYFSTVGYRESSNFYDEQEKSMFSFTPMEKLDGALVAPDTYDMNGFRECLFEMLDKRANCPIVCVRDSQSEYDSLLLHPHSQKERGGRTFRCDGRLHLARGGAFKRNNQAVG